MSEGLYADRLRDHWFPARLPACACFQAGIAVTTDRSAGFFRSSFILPAAISPSEFLRHSLPLLALRPELTARVPCPPHDLTGRVHHSRGVPCPRSVPSPGSRNLSTAFSALQLAGLFHPAAVSRASYRTGASYPSRSRSPSSGELLPPCRCAPLRSPCRSLAATRWSPRLRGLAPREDAHHRSGVQSPRRPLPSSVSTSSRCSVSRS